MFQRHTELGMKAGGVLLPAGPVHKKRKTTAGELTDAEVQRLKEGVELSREDGFAAFQDVERRGGVQQKSVKSKSGEEIEKFQYSADVRIKCGKFHVVKRLFMSVGKSVVRLQRLAIGGLSLDDCFLHTPGDFKELSAEQIQALKNEDPPASQREPEEISEALEIFSILFAIISLISRELDRRSRFDRSNEVDVHLGAEDMDPHTTPWEASMWSDQELSESLGEGSVAVRFGTDGVSQQKRREKNPERVGGFDRLDDGRLDGPKVGLEVVEKRKSCACARRNRNSEVVHKVQVFLSSNRRVRFWVSQRSSQLLFSLMRVGSFITCPHQYSLHRKMGADGGLRHVVHKRVHLERQQPKARRKLGYLEKHKDYVKRAKDFHKKQDEVKRLHRKAYFKNEDEFSIKMMDYFTNKDVVFFSTA
eukprot:symbB.v1.2.010064.t4/scaffold652.1/size176119/5